ncbi:MAG: hypothetical protein U0744_08715 [Gemmataceae bacterium]
MNPTWKSRAPFLANGALLLTWVACALLSGCSDGKHATVQVKGQVVSGKDKKPAAGAAVIFHPAKTEPGDSHKPIGITDESGRYSLTTYREGDGAPEGEYVVTVRWPMAKKSPLDTDPRDRLNEAFSNVKNSKIRMEVKSGKDLPPIELP